MTDEIQGESTQLPIQTYTETAANFNPQVSLGELKAKIYRLHEAMRILQNTLDNHLCDEDGSVNLLRIGAGIGQAIELTNTVYLELVLKTGKTTEELDKWLDRE